MSLLFLLMLSVSVLIGYIVANLLVVVLLKFRDHLSKRAEAYFEPKIERKVTQIKLWWRNRKEDK